MHGGKGIEKRGRVRGSKRFLSVSVIFFKKKKVFMITYTIKREHEIQLQQSSEF